MIGIDLNTDIHQMINANGRKSRHLSSNNKNDTMQSKNLNPNLTREEDKNDSLEKSSNLSSGTERKDMCL